MFLKMPSMAFWTWTLYIKDQSTMVTFCFYIEWPLQTGLTVFTQISYYTYEANRNAPPLSPFFLFFFLTKMFRRFALQTPRFATASYNVRIFGCFIFKIWQRVLRIVSFVRQCNLITSCIKLCVLLLHP